MPRVSRSSAQQRSLTRAAGACADRPGRAASPREGRDIAGTPLDGGDEEDDDWEWKNIASHEPPSLADFTVADQLRMGAAPRRSWVPPRGRKGEKPLEPKVKVTSMLYPHMVKYQ